MKRIFLCMLALLAFATGAWAVESLVQIKGLSHDQIVDMANAGYDIPAHGPDFIEVVVDTQQLKTLKQEGVEHKVVVSDLGAMVRRRLSAQKEAAQPYYTYATMVETMKKWVAAYPTICRMESIGKSYENRDIWALKISDNPEKNEKEPAALIMGAHHSREWISVEVPMATAKAMLEGFGTDERLTRLVNERETWFVPMVNPDGVTFSQTSQQFWRKNRRKNANGTYGVDPNRNYGYKWGAVGSSNSPSADTYHGTGPFSEPETCAIRDFATREQFSADISFHSYSELILYPFSWGYPDEAPNPHQELFATFAQEMAAFNRYRPQVSSDLYPSMGDTDDFMYGELKSLSFTFELARQFIPPQAEIPKINAVNVPAVLHLIEKAGTYGLVSPTGEEQITELSATDLIAAIKDLTPLAKADDIAARLQKVQNQLVLRVLNERRHGESTILTQIEKEAANHPAFSGILRLYGQGVRFDQLHHD
ncbi:MAG TPA: M14 family metallopeptidase [Candidatus Ozemobacteraceae bacterium]|nr:M14 family metallopeptidase [Candidatus Ozemobacteraceae bacterium]